MASAIDQSTGGEGKTEASAPKILERLVRRAEHAGASNIQMSLKTRMTAYQKHHENKMHHHNFGLYPAVGFGRGISC